MTEPTPRTEAGRALLRTLDYIGAHSSDTSFPMALDDILAIEAEAAAQARTEAIDESRCWFCQRMVPVDALIAGYDTFDEQRLACMACNEVMRARTEALDVEALRQAIYETSVTHDWENTIDRDDRTAEIASRYAAILAVVTVIWGREREE